MKQVMFGLSGTVIVILILLIIMTIDGKTIRSNEVEDSLHAVLKSSLADVMERREYTIEDDDELIADLTAQMMRQLNTNDRNLKLDVEIAGIDAKKGLLAVHVRETFTYPNGRRGRAEESSCIVLEREKEREIYMVSFLLPKKEAEKLHVPVLYRTFHISEGKLFKAPDTVYGRRVTYWQLSGSDGVQITPEDLRKKKVSGETSYVAVF